MTRWVPAIGIAGFARWFVSGRRRSPTPPTRTNARDSVSAIPAPSCGAAVHAHPAAKPAQPALGGGEMGDYADVLDAAARVRPFGLPAGATTVFAPPRAIRAISSFRTLAIFGIRLLSENNTLVKDTMIMGVKTIVQLNRFPPQADNPAFMAALPAVCSVAMPSAGTRARRPQSGTISHHGSRGRNAWPHAPVRRADGGQRHRPRGAARQFVRFHRPQRRRQVHHDQVSDLLLAPRRAIPRRARPDLPPGVLCLLFGAPFPRDADAAARRPPRRAGDAHPIPGAVGRRRGAAVLRPRAPNRACAALGYDCAGTGPALRAAGPRVRNPRSRSPRRSGSCRPASTLQASRPSARAVAPQWVSTSASSRF